MSLDTLHLHKAAHKLKALSGKKKKSLHTIEKSNNLIWTRDEV